MTREVLSKHYPGLPQDVAIVIHPNEEDIPDERLSALHRRWILDCSDRHGLATKQIVETPELYKLLRNVMLLEIERPEHYEYDYVYRIYGADIAKRYGRDMTGKRTSDFPGPVSKLFLDLYEIAIERRLPIYSEHAPPLNVDVKVWQRLILPLGGKDVQWILTVNIPKGKRMSGEQQDVFYIE